MRRAEALQVRGVRELGIGASRDAADENVVVLWKILYLPILPAVGARVWIEDSTTPLGLVLEVEDVRPCELLFPAAPSDTPKPLAPGDWPQHVDESAGPAWEIAFAREYDSQVAPAIKEGWHRLAPPPKPPKPPPPRKDAP